MLALLSGDPPQLVRDHPHPKRAPGEALLRLRLGGICDTDLQLCRGYMSFSGVLGHELVADVLASESKRWEGRRVVADINAGCGTCSECRQARGHHCSSRTVLGIFGRDGCLAEELVMPERCLVEVPDSVSDEQAVFAEPLAAALHVLDELPADLDGPVLVLGDGKLGLLVALGLRSREVPVLLVGRHADKLEIARRAGASALLEPELAPERHSARVVVEATGSAGGIAAALRLTAPRGTLVLKTTVAGPTAVDLSPVVINELRVVGSRCGDLGRAIDALATGKIDPRPLIAARYPLASAEQAVAHAGRRGTLKVLVEGAGA